MQSRKRTATEYSGPSEMAAYELIVVHHGTTIEARLRSVDLLADVAGLTP